jgi:hypothetical protein
MILEILMKKILLLTLVTVFSLALERNADLSKMSLEDIESFFYEKGRKDGLKRGYQQGYKDAITYATKKLERYSSKIKAIEYGKYLRNKISAPEVYQVKDQFGNIKVVVKGCRFEQPLKPHEIIDLPIFPQDVCSDTVIDTSNSLQNDDHIISTTNSANIIKRDQKLFSGKINDISSDTNTVFYYIPNKSYFRTKLAQLNMIYTIENDKIKVIFHSKQERDNFIKNFLGR